MKAAYGDILPKGCNLKRFVNGTRRLGVEFDDDEDVSKWPSVIESFRDHIRTMYTIVGTWPVYPQSTPNVMELSDMTKDLHYAQDSRCGNFVRWLGFHVSIRVNMKTDTATEVVEAPPGTFNGLDSTNGAITVRLMILVDHRSGASWTVSDCVKPVEDMGQFLQTDSLKPYQQSCIFDRRIVVSSTGESMVNEQHFIDCDFVSEYVDNNDTPLTNRIRCLKFSNITRELVNADIVCRVKGFFFSSQ